ncbi:hypothetical protein ABID23_001422 [Bartonella silvatica]|uniref:Uncharacterized protein n=1 Tax=Bartonella silvatica TaxID=357760 RepID=A0ABV2HID7_9HYPH
MSKSQYKMGKAMSTLRKIRRLLLIQQRHIYKKCLLLIHINNTGLSLLGNHAPFKLRLHHHNSLFYKQIKSYVEMRIIQYCKLYNKNITAYFHK